MPRIRIPKLVLEQLPLMARKLKNVLKRNQFLNKTEVIGCLQINDRAIKVFAVGAPDPKFLGYYYSDKDEIYINSEALTDDVLETLVHEVAHAIDRKRILACQQLNETEKYVYSCPIEVDAELAVVEYISLPRIIRRKPNITPAQMIAIMTKDSEKRMQAWAKDKKLFNRVLKRLDDMILRVRKKMRKNK
jgi:hypothetical protein